MSELTMGQIMDGLDIQHTIAEGELVAGAVVILEVVEADGDIRLSVAWPEGMSWLKRAGMLHHALAEETTHRVGDA
jgi:hypothetical protein